MDQGEVGMFTQRVKASWPCLGLDVQSDLVGCFEHEVTVTSIP